MQWFPTTCFSTPRVSKPGLWFPILALALTGTVLVAAPAEAGKKAVEAPSTFEGFPHDRHNNYWGAKELNCTSCHGFGDAGKVTWENTSVTPPTPLRGEDFRPMCHQCHVAELDYSPMMASPCETCHKTPPVPKTHGAGWKEVHGADARVQLRECRECHKTSFCVDCHERKESIRYNVHDRTWLTVHGMAARTAPQGCDDCHIKSTCESCHKAAGGKWP